MTENLFDTLDPVEVDRYVERVRLAQEVDVLVQNPEELGRWLCLLATRQSRFNARVSPLYPVLVYAEVGVSAGGTFRLTREVLKEYGDPYCIAFDDCSDEGFKLFMKWMKEDPEEVRLIKVDVDDPGAANILTSQWIPDIDACLLDAAHTYESTYNAFRLLQPYIASYGLMAFHDTTDPRCPDVMRAVFGIVGEGDWEVVAHHNAQFGLTVLGRQRYED